MGDYFIRVTAAGGRIRGFFATTAELVEFARKAHNTSPVVTAALGRLLTGGVMMGAMMKNDADLLTIKINGDGPIGGLTVTADANGNVKGYANNPVVMIPVNEKGKLDVASAVGVGVLQVIKDIGLKEPYIGDTILVTSEIAEDLTYYFATSEQTPSSVGLGVLMSKDNTVKCAGGMILQLMPDADESVVSLLEERVKEKDEEAMWMLGLCYEYGIGCERDLTRAETLYKQSCDGGNVIGKFLKDSGENNGRGSGMMIVCGL